MVLSKKMLFFYQHDVGRAEPKIYDWFFQSLNSNLWTFAKFSFELKQFEEI